MAIRKNWTATSTEDVKTVPSVSVNGALGLFKWKNNWEGTKA
jgi:hypothetical protein